MKELLNMRELPKGARSPFAIALALYIGLAPVLLGAALAPAINWLYFILCCIGVAGVAELTHIAHDFGVPPEDTQHKRYSKRVAISLIATFIAIGVGISIYFTFVVSPLIWVFWAVGLLGLLYVQGLLRHWLMVSVLLAVAVLGSAFVQTSTIGLSAIVMAAAFFTLGYAFMKIYQLDEVMGSDSKPVLTKEGHVKLFTGLLAWALTTLIIAVALVV